MTNLTVRDKAQQISTTIMSAPFKSQLAGAMGVPASDPVIDRFARVAMRAVQEDPKLLDADRNSLFLACQAAATDGLMPDGREGKLVTYRTKVNNQWIDKVQWQRMVGGIRKLAAERGFDIIAQTVYAADTFDYEAGTRPHITHKPAVFARDRGDVLGYYAIATRSEDGRQWFEVMSFDEVAAIADRSKSKDQNGNLVGPWKTDRNEMGKKTVVKRMFKSLPLFDSKLDDLIRRDNSEEFDPIDTPAAQAPEPAAQAHRATTRPSALQAVVDAAPEAAGDAIDVEATEVIDQSTGEVTQQPAQAAGSVEEYF